MNATKTSLQQVNGLLEEWDANGSLPCLKWIDAAGNNWRAMGFYQFDNNQEVYIIVVTKFLQLAGTTEWIIYSQYQISTDDTGYRVLSTGQPILGNYRGEYDASSNLFPETGGSGASGAIVKGDNWEISVAGILNGSPVVPGDKIIALDNAPGQDGAKWGFTVPLALDNKGNIINPNGWVPSAKFFTILIGYNPSGQPVSINYFVYNEIAQREGLTIV